MIQNSHSESDKWFDYVQQKLQAEAKAQSVRGHCYLTQSHMSGFGILKNPPWQALSLAESYTSEVAAVNALGASTNGSGKFDLMLP